MGLATLREAIASAVSQPVASAITVLMVAGMCATVLLTTGRTVGAEQAVLGSIDSVGTRSIVVRAEPEAGLASDVIDRLRGIEGIAWAGALGPVVDYENASVPGAAKVPVRLAWSEDWSQLGVQNLQPVPDYTAWASARALGELGATAAAGGLVNSSGVSYSIGGMLDTPDFLNFLEPLIVVPQASNSARPEVVNILIIVASAPELVAPVSQVVQTMLGLEESAKVTIETSEDLATLRSLIEGQLGTYGRTLVILVFSVSAVLVAAILFGLVMMRRKDFGRRRALGAARGLIVALVLSQVGLLSAVGAAAGVIIALLALHAGGDPLPPFDFNVSVAFLAVFVGIVAGVTPAVAASRRDPLVELRVP